MATEIIKVPDLGEIDSAEVIEIPVAAGDVISADDTVLVLESDKASMEVPAEVAGKITQIKINVGDKVSEGTVILYVETDAGSTDSSETKSSDQTAKSTSKKAGSSTNSQVQSVIVPDLGGASEVEIIELMAKVGNQVEIDDPIAVLESDKASMEIPSTVSGEIVSVKVSTGDKVSEGDLMIEVMSADAGISDTSEAPSAGTESNADSDNDSESSKINVPDIGGAEGVEVIDVLVAEGDEIQADDPIIVLESDKASMEVPAPSAGRVARILVKVGDKVSEGDAIAEMVGAAKSSTSPKAEKSESPASTKKAQPEQRSAPVQTAPADDDEAGPSAPVHAGPAVRKLAREFGVDLAKVKGSGPKGRIVKDDVASWVKTRLQEPEKATAGAGIPEIPDQDYSKFGDIETKDLTRIQQITAQNMARNWLNVPHVTQFEEADVTDLEEFRKSLKPEMEKRGVKISSLAFVVKACAAALHEYPKFNVSLMSDGRRFVQKSYCHIGIAVDTPNGLIVPVIRDADKKSVWQIAAEIIDLATRGRKGQVKPNEMQGGCFTISSLGGLGGVAFTPIVNAPEVAILGLSNNQIKPVWNGKEFVPRTMTPLSLSYDHRAINGADAAKFTTYLAKVLGDIRNLVL